MQGHAGGSVRVARREHVPRLVRLIGRDHCRWRAAFACLAARSGRALRSGYPPRPVEPALASRLDPSALLNCFHLAKLAAKLGDRGPKIGKLGALCGFGLPEFALDVDPERIDLFNAVIVDAEEGRADNI